MEKYIMEKGMIKIIEDYKHNCLMCNNKAINEHFCEECYETYAISRDELDEFYDDYAKTDNLGSNAFWFTLANWADEKKNAEKYEKVKKAEKMESNKFIIDLINRLDRLDTLKI